MKNAVIFDLDGTLWDSTVQVVTAWNKALSKREDVDFVMSVGDMKKLMGKTIDEIAGIIFPDRPHAMAMEIIDLCLAEEVSYLRENSGTLYAGLEETLQALSKQFELALVSNCQIEYLEAFFDTSGLGKYFCDFECAGRTGLSKGENIKLVSQRNKFGSVIYVGDTQGDYDAAKIAHARFIHASYGFGTINGEDYATITSIKELPERACGLISIGPKNHFVSVAGITVNQRNEVLLVKSPLRGWEFPGGMVEPGESLQDALKREIYEESGMTVDITGFIGICKNIQSDIVNIDFCCAYISGEPTTSDESIDVGWFPMDVAAGMMGNPLYEKRLRNMLSRNSDMYCFSFSKHPFEVFSDDTFKVGLS